MINELLTLCATHPQESVLLARKNLETEDDGIFYLKKLIDCVPVIKESRSIFKFGNQYDMYSEFQNLNEIKKKGYLSSILFLTDSAFSI